MRAWAVVLGGLAVWAAHFVALYAIASALPGRPDARWLVLAATIPAIAGDALILWKTIGSGRRSDPLDDWIVRLGALGAAISGVAVAWQALPALAL
jgi:NO-binding membrane sensor protein with MHYT domain